MPEQWSHEFASVSASLEQADDAFSRIQRGMEEYSNTYGSYMSGAESNNLFRIYYELIRKDRTNRHLAIMTAKLANGLGRYEKTIEILEPLAGPDDPSLLCELGIAKCMGSASSSPEFVSGQKILERTILLSPHNTFALLSLAGSFDIYEADKPAERAKYLQQAYEADPSDPAVLCEYIQWYLETSSKTKVPRIVLLMRPAIADALKRCEDQAKVGLNVPWVDYRAAYFHLLLDDREEQGAIKSYAKVMKSQQKEVIQASLRSLERSESFSSALKSYESVDRLKLLLEASRGKNNAISHLQRLSKHRIETNPTDNSPVTIVAGEAGETAPEGTVPTAVSVQLPGAEPIKWDGLKSGHEFESVLTDLFAGGVQPENVTIVDNGALSDIAYSVALGLGITVIAGELSNLFS